MALSVLQTHTKHYLKHKLEISVTEHQFRAAKEPLDQDLIMQVQFHQRWLRQLSKRLQWPTDKANQKNKCTENSQTILHPNNWDVVTLHLRLKTCLWKVFQASKINQKVKTFKTKLNFRLWIMMILCLAATWANLIQLDSSQEKPPPKFKDKTSTSGMSWVLILTNTCENLNLNLIHLMLLMHMISTSISELEWSIGWLKSLPISNVMIKHSSWLLVSSIDISKDARSRNR